MSGMQENRQAAYERIHAWMHGPGDVYGRLNALRDWVNSHFPEFELYLEDVWNEHKEGETRFEYILRSRQTLYETDVLGYDIYLNHRDAKGVWHLDDYQSSTWLVDDPNVVLHFLQTHGNPCNN